MADTSAFSRPGRLGTPNLSLVQDPRLNTSLKNVLIAVGFKDLTPGAMPSDVQGMLPHLQKQSDETDAVFSAVPLDIPSDEHEPNIEPEQITIDGQDGNKILLYVFRPVRKDPAPCVIYTHGGGMTVISTAAPPHMQWAKGLALKGCVAVVVDFRNALYKGSHLPFPAGLNDCVAAAKWVDGHRSELNINNIILNGESGGGNLACATALRAKREGWADKIAGVYAYVPYISGKYGLSQEEKLKQFPSMVENDNYIIHCSTMAGMAYFYSPDNLDHAEAWPLNATEEELKGLPPHYLSMDELDPLRDEGIAYYRKLDAAGVRVVAEVNLGFPHGAPMLFRQAVPEAHEKIQRQIVGFANSLVSN